MTETPLLRANTCGNCAFFEPPEPDSDALEPLGRCHFNAPTYQLLQASGRAVWPYCAPTDWCGRWEAIPA